jgi:hypothetical protein
MDSSITMTSTRIDDTDEWPSLTGTQHIHPTTLPLSTSRTTDASGCGEQDWEILETLEDGEDDAVPEDQLQQRCPDPCINQESHIPPLAKNPKTLRHSASSPNLRESTRIIVVMNENKNGLLEEISEHEEDDSFAMVSGPGSVWSQSISGVPGSFRDAILSSSSSSTADHLGRYRNQQPPQSSPKRTSAKVRPRFVVVAAPSNPTMRRCSKSTGDLQSLSRNYMNQNKNNCINDVYHHQEEESEEILGASDAMEFYHQKAAGAMNRSHGLKLRPDELKRKEMILQKKKQQQQDRQQSANKSKKRSS